MVVKNLSDIDAIFALSGTTHNTSLKKSKPDHPGPSQGKGTKACYTQGNGASNEKVQGSADERRLKKMNSSNGRPDAKRRAGEDAQSHVEILIDPSQSLLNPTPNLKPSNKKQKHAHGLPSQVDLGDEQERAFRDSRGTRAKTEDGLLIYSVEELKIGLGQDTPDCPFDCQCCF